jgi:hypothetical protein
MLCVNSESGPKCPIEVRAVRLLAFEIHQSFFQTDEKLARFLKEHLAKTVVRTATQSHKSLTRSRGRGSKQSTRQDAPDPTPEHFRFYRLHQPTCHSLSMRRLKLTGMVARQDENRQETVRRQVADGSHQRKPVSIGHFQVSQ